MNFILPKYVLSHITAILKTPFHTYLIEIKCIASILYERFQYI